MDPRYIFPDAKSIIGLGFRIPRGYLRGIEEGTFFSIYEFMGYSGMNWRYMPHIMHTRNNPAIGGGRGCLRACYAHLEARGKLTHKFVKPFKRHKEWVLD